MEIKLNKNVFLSNFLNPVNKIADKGILSVSKNEVECISCSSYDKKEQTIILYSKCSINSDITDTKVQLNLPNIKKLINAISFINQENITLKIDNNSLSYSSDSDDINFRYHLLENGVLENPTVKMENVYAIGFDFEAIIEKSSLQKVLKGSIFSDQSNKIYLYTKNNELQCELTDNSVQNTDSISFSLSNNTTGKQISKIIALNLEIFRVLSSLDFESLIVKINQDKGIIMFELKKENCLLQYIVTTLIK